MAHLQTCIENFNPPSLPNSTTTIISLATSLPLQINLHRLLTWPYIETGCLSNLHKSIFKYGRTVNEAKEVRHKAKSKQKEKELLSEFVIFHKQVPAPVEIFTRPLSMFVYQYLFSRIF